MTQETKPVYDQAMVIYSDGSCKPNPGMIGFGFHGYRYDITNKKKITTPTGQTITTLGYATPEQAKEVKEGITEVIPTVYFDAYGCSRLLSSNNAAEVLAASEAFRLAATQDGIKHVLVKTDSQYVRRGVDEWAHGWVRDRWIKHDGTPVANKEHWQALLANIAALDAKGIKHSIVWVKGHSDVFGNEIADARARTGSNYSNLKYHVNYDFQSKDFHVEVLERPAPGYWNQETMRHPMLMSTRYYFNTLRRSHVPGEYFLASHSNKAAPEDTGKPGPEDAYAVVHLAKPCESLEMIRDYQARMSGDVDNLFGVKMDNLFGKNRENELRAYGVGALSRIDPRRMDLAFLDGEPITEQFNPLRRAMYVMDWISTLKAMLLNVEQGLTSHYHLTDVTASIYEQVEGKKGKTVTQIKPEFVVGYKYFDVDVLTAKGPTKVRLSLGLDLPERNSLKKLESDTTKVQVLVWHQSPDVIRYAVVIAAGEDRGIWAAFHSNLVILT